MPSKAVDTVFLMPYTLNELKLLAFVVLFKSKRRNSMFHFQEKYHNLAKELGISKNTAKKYIIQLKNLGLIKPTNGRESIIKLTDCIKVLLGKENSDYRAFKYVRFMRGYNYPTLSFKEVYKAIQIGIVKLNINQQEYWNSKVLKAKESLLKNRITASELRSAKAITKRLGLPNISALQCINDGDYVAKTGRNHLSRLLGCHSSTGSKRLRIWAKEYIIERKVIYKDLGIISTHATFDLLKNKYSKLFTNKSGMFYVILGSTVSFIEAI